MTGFDNRTRRFAYDARGALTAYTDERGRTRRYNYDRRGRLQTITEADGTHRTIERDARGRALRLTAATRPPARPAARPTAARAKATGQDEPPPGGYPDDPGAYEYVYVWTLASNSLLFNRTLFDGLDLPEEPNVESSIGGGSLDIYEQCVARQRQMCSNSRTACGTKAFGEYGVATGICVGVIYVNPPLGAICMAAAFAKYLSNLAACDLDWQNCHLAIPDKCRS